MAPENEQSQGQKEGGLPKRVLVIDDDESIGILVKQILEEAGIEDVQAFDSAEAGWEKSLEEEFDFIILDWKMPTVTGAALLNRFRQHKFYYKIPIMISSGFLGKDDMALLGEFFLVGKFEKPVQKGAFVRRVSEIYNEYSWFVAKEAQILELFSKIKDEQDSTKTMKAFEKILLETKKPVPLGVSVARVLCQEKKYKEAEKILKFILERSPDSVYALHELGKIHLLNKSYDEAKKILMQAFKHSPQNLERLNLLGNVSLQKLEMEEAEKFFDKALAVDQQSKMAVKGKTVVDNIKGYMSQSDLGAIPESFASLLNAVGVSFVKNKDFNKGIEHYRSALPYLNDADLKAKVSFNVGLAYLRWEKPKEALNWLNISADSSVEFVKSKELIPKVQKILDGAKKTAKSEPLEEMKGDEGAASDSVESSVAPDPNYTAVTEDHDAHVVDTDNLAEVSEEKIVNDDEYFTSKNKTLI